MMIPAGNTCPFGSTLADSGKSYSVRNNGAGRFNPRYLNRGDGAIENAPALPTAVREI